MVYDRKWLLLSCLRPKEPSIYPKCDRKIFVNEDNEYLPERYRQIAEGLKDKFSHQANITVDVPKILAPDIIPITAAVKKRGNFSLFIPSHRQAAANLITMFMASKEAGELMAMGTFVKDRANPYLFQYAYQVALLHHPAAKGLPLPSVLEQFPEQFIDPVTFPLLMEENMVVDPNERVMIEVPRNFTASDLEDEQRLAYFREDIGVNMHHWHWHLVYPYEGPIEIVRKDRRGELFYYMHSQLVARYESERLSNGMPRIVVYSNFRAPIKEGYYSKLLRNTNMRPYPGRAPNTVPSDVDRPDEDAQIAIDENDQFRSNILFAIDQGFAIAADGTRVPLNNDQGIDILGDMIEASILSVNPNLYGDWHNDSHIIIAFAHDPDGRYNESYGVMGDTSTAMRDPIFYRYHLHVDDIFQRHKRQLPNYSRRQLGYPPVQVSSVGVKIPRENAAPNVLLTFWQRSQVDLSAGLDFASPGRAFISFIHLQHADYNYEINVNNNGTAPLTGTCRIFLTPEYDDQGRPFTFEEQRRLMIELDKFVVTLIPGENTIRRSSQDSSVTITWERSFALIGAINRLDDPNFDQEQAEFCGCGWPQHMLLPKGNKEGMKFKLFVMVSNFADDNVNQVFDENVDCNDAHSFCGLRNQLYPDRRPMGFPFDRPFDVGTLDEFVNLHSNMMTTDVTIRFIDSIVNRNQ